MTELHALSPLADTLLAAVSRAAVQGGIGILAVVAICALLPRIGASLRCWLWRFAFARLVIALFWSAPLLLPLPAPTAPPVDTSAPITVSVSSAEPRLDAGPAAPTVEIDPRAGFLLLWLAGAVWCARLGLLRLRAAEELRRRATPVMDPSLLRQWQELAAALGLRRLPELREATEIESPVCLHTARTTVVLPRSLSQGWDGEQIRLMLAHELEHIRRHDLVWSWLPASAHLLFYFHPLVWLANREWRLAHDMAADDLALQVTRAPASEYARLLVRVAGSRSTASAGLAMMDARDTAQTLQRRLTTMKRLLNNPGRSTPAGWLLSLLLACAILVPVRVIALASSTPSSDAPQVERPAADRRDAAAARDPLVEDRARAERRYADRARAERSAAEGDRAAAPESADRQRKAREAERTDPAAGARVATPQLRNAAEPETSEDVYPERVYLDVLAADPTREEIRKFGSDLASGKRKVALGKLKGPDDQRLRALEDRIRLLELELRRLREPEVRLDVERRLEDRSDAALERMRRPGKSKKQEEPYERDYDKVRDRVLRERRDEESVLSEKRKEKRKRDADPNKGAPREDREPSRPEVEELERVIERKSLMKRLKGVETDDVRRDLGIKGVHEELERPAARPAPGKGGALQLSVRMLRPAADGNRLLSATETSFRLGEWIAVGVPSGQLKRPLNEVDPEQVMQIRVSQSKVKRVLNLEVRMSRKDAPKLISAKIGQTIRLTQDGEGDDPHSSLFELQVTGTPGTAFLDPGESRPGCAFEMNAHPGLPFQPAKYAASIPSIHRCTCSASA